MSYEHQTMPRGPEDIERGYRIEILMLRGMTLKAAETVVDAAMYGIGCTEGEVRVRIQKELDEESDMERDRR